MQNPFFNKEENRLRAFFRICFFLLMFIVTMGVFSIFQVRWLGMLTASLVILVLYYISFRYMDLRSWNLSGLILSRSWWIEFFAGTVIAASGVSLIFLVEWLFGDLEISKFVWQNGNHLTSYYSIFAFLLMMLAVSFYEEIMARGYLLRNMAEGFSFASISSRQATIIAVFLSSGLFGLAHAGNPNISIFAIINIVLAGIMLAIPFVITERLSMPIGIHFAWNFFQGGVFGFSVSGIKTPNSIIHIYQGGPGWWTGGAFGPEGGVIGILGILIILLLSVYFLKKTGNAVGISVNFKKKYNSNYKV